MYNNFQEATTAWQSDSEMFAQLGASMPGIKAYLPEPWKRDIRLAQDSLPELMGMDAQPALTTTANSAVPFFLTTLVDPKIFKVLFSPVKAAIIFGETRKGSWLDETAMFPLVEHTGEVSSYGDFAENGRAGVNTAWPQRQSYLFQTIKEYGDRELERAGLAKINWVSEIDQAAAMTLNRYSNFTYFFGVAGLQNYGLLNDPSLAASITPGGKAAGGVKWFTTGGQINATANEVYQDIQALFFSLVNQTGGLIDAESKIVLATSPAMALAFTATNSFNVNVYDLLKKNYPNIRFETAVQYGVASTSNPQGQSAGNLVQMFAEDIEGQDTGYCSFNEKMYAQPIVRGLSSYRQKVVGGTWGAVIRMPVSIVSMLGV